MRLFQNFQVFNKEGRLLFFVGNGGGRLASSQFLPGMAIDGNDMIYVVGPAQQEGAGLSVYEREVEKRQAEQPKR